MIAPFVEEDAESMADLFRQISYDERMHKLDSLTRIREPCFVSASRLDRST